MAETEVCVLCCLHMHAPLAASIIGAVFRPPEHYLSEYLSSCKLLRADL